MANTNTLYRKANVSSADALAQLAQRFPGDEVVAFEKRAVTADEVRAAGAPEGELVYVATIRVAEFPPAGGDDKSDSDSDSDDSGSDSKPFPPKKEESSDPDNDGDDDSSAEGDTDDDFAGADKGAKPEKPDFQTELLHLLKLIADGLSGGAPGGPGDLGPGGPPPGGPGDLDLPDVGAPDKGEGLPPVDGPPGGKPLPPPVKEKSPVGVGAFASVAGRNEAYLVREADAGNKQIIAEVEEYAPEFKVARIQRTGSARLNGSVVSLPDTGKVVVTLVKR